MRINHVLPLLLLATAVFLHPVKAEIQPDTASATQIISPATGTADSPDFKPAMETGASLSTALTDINEPALATGAAIPAELVLNNPENSASATVAPAEDLQSAATETAAIDLSATGSAEISEVSSDTVAIEPFARTSIKDLRKHLAIIAELYLNTGEYRDLALALTAAESDDRVFRRTCEFLLREASLRALSPYSALLIFPRWLETANIIELDRLEKAIKDFASDMVRDPQARAALLHRLNENLKNSEALKALLRQVGNDINHFCKNSETQLKLRNIAGELPDFFKKQNRELLQIVLEQNSKFGGLLNQLDHHQVFYRKYLDFLQDANQKIHGSAAGVRLSRILRSCRDFRNLQLNYKEDLMESKEKLSKFIKQRQQSLQNLVSVHFRSSARIKDYSGRFPRRDVDPQSETVFSADEQLKRVFAILALMADQTDSAQPEADQPAGKDGLVSVDELMESLGKFINGNEWSKEELTEDFEAISQP